MPLPHTIRRTALALALASAPAAVLLPAPAFAEEVKGLDGRWQGALSTPAGDLTLVIRVATADGNTTAILNSPDQTDMDIPVSAVRRDGDRIVFDVAMVQGSFTADLSDDGRTLAGEWEQMGNALPLEMTRQ